MHIPFPKNIRTKQPDLHITFVYFSSNFDKQTKTKKASCSVFARIVATNCRLTVPSSMVYPVPSTVVPRYFKFLPASLRASVTCGVGVGTADMSSKPYQVPNSRTAKNNYLFFYYFFSAGSKTTKRRPPKQKRRHTCTSSVCCCMVYREGGHRHTTA